MRRTWHGAYMRPAVSQTVVKLNGLEEQLDIVSKRNNTQNPALQTSMFPKSASKST